MERIRRFMAVALVAAAMALALAMPAFAAKPAGFVITCNHGPQDPSALYLEGTSVTALYAQAAAAGYARNECNIGVVQTSSG